MIEFIVLRWYYFILSIWNFTLEAGWGRGNPFRLLGVVILEYDDYRLTILRVQVVKLVIGLHYELLEEGDY